MDIIKLIDRLIIFTLGLVTLVLLGYWGFQGDKTLFFKIILGIGTPLTVATAWGFLVAPHSPFRLDMPYRAIFSITIFLLAAFLLYQTGNRSPAILFSVISVLAVTLTLIRE